MFNKDAMKKIKSSVVEKLRNMNFDITENLIKEIDELLVEAESLIDYKVQQEIYDNFKIDQKENRIILNEKDYLLGKYIVKSLQKAEYIVLAIITLGERVDKRISDYFSCGDYTKGLILDTIAGVVLENLTINFWNGLKENAQKYGKGITEIFYPGSKWDIKNQAVIFKVVNASRIGVSINESFMMTPEKTVSFVCGIGEDLKSCVMGTSCDDCEMENCVYRKSSATKAYNVTVHFNGETKMIAAKEGENLFRLLVKNGIYLSNSCGGNRICGKCKVILGEKSNISSEEAYFLTQKEREENVRLACFVNIDRDLEVTVLYYEEKANILTTEKSSLDVSLNSRIKKYVVEVSPHTLEDQRDYVKKVCDLLGGKIKISLSLVGMLPQTLEQHDYKVSCAVRKNELISVEDKALNDKNFGIALDVGTTTIAAYLYDLNLGKQIDVYSCLNPQRVFGADVISRINYTITEPLGLYKMHSALIDKINEIIERFSQKNSISRNNIYEIVAVGNPTMIHFLLNIPCKHIAVSPYVPTFTSKMEIKAKEIGVNINKEGYVITLPLVSSYVGADIVASILASKIDKYQELCLLVDIGTNGEMVLGNKYNLVASSAAAGPAFEGARITFGVNGIEGAIDHVDFGKRPFYTTIGDKKAKGICGSGIIDIISEFLKYGIIDSTGRFLPKEEVKNLPIDIAQKITVYKDEPAFLIENGIYVTQKDIRQIQLAKGAIIAGINIMIKEMGIDVNDIKKVFLAGGFGNYIFPPSAITIGLLPKELEGKIIQIGNSAGIGAIMALLSDKELERATQLQKKIKYIELSTHKDFQHEYIKGMYF